jgi:hypothetical protein
MLGLDSDNGSEFINGHLHRYCQAHGIQFTRGRPYKKDDKLETLTELYGYLRLYVNFFQPSMKLREKTRTGARVTRRYDTPATPFRRLLASPHISAKVKTALRRQYLELNPVELQRQITTCQTRLLALVRRKRERARRGGNPRPDHPWKRSYKRAFEVRQRKGSSRT